MSSYGVIVPYSKLLIMVNQQVDDYVDKLLVITPSTSESGLRIQEYEEGVHSVLLDEWHAYTTICMSFTTKQRSVATVRLLDGSHFFGDERDQEAALMIARFVMLYELGFANGFLGEKIIDHSVKTCGNVKEEEEEICVICQTEFEAGEMCQALECGHWYHKECIDKWLNHKNRCPICRDEVIWV